MERTTNFALVLPEYSRPALKVLHFDRSGYLGGSARNNPFHLSKLLSPVPLFWYPAYKNNNQKRGGLVRVCATGMHRFIGYVEFPKFLQTGKRKRPLLKSRDLENHAMLSCTHLGHIRECLFFPSAIREYGYHSIIFRRRLWCLFSWQ